MKIVAMNLQSVGGDRIGRLTDYLIATDADIIVCTELRSNARREQLCGRLMDAGYSCFHESGKHEAEGRVAIATRQQSRKIKLNPDSGDAHRIVGCELDGIAILGVYFARSPKKEDVEKVPLFKYLLAGRPEHEGEMLIIGDFDTGPYRIDIDEEGEPFDRADLFERLTNDAGYIDLWRRKKMPEEQRTISYKCDNSWILPEGGEYRLHHAFGTAKLAERVDSCEYDQTTRKNGLSDHSAMIVEIESQQG